MMPILDADAWRCVATWLTLNDLRRLANVCSDAHTGTLEATQAALLLAIREARRAHNWPAAFAAMDAFNEFLTITRDESYESTH